MRDMHLDGADLSGCELTGVNLKRASLKRADLRSAQLCGADLSNTNLAGADLRDANLSGAHLSSTILNGCDLRGANLAGAHIVTFCWNRRTRFAGVKGLDIQPDKASDNDPTQAFPSQLAMADYSDSEPSALTDPDPALEKTHIYSPVITGFITPDLPHTSADIVPVVTSTWRSRFTIAASLLLAVGGATYGFWGWSQAKPATVSTHDHAHLIVEIANLQQQHEADLSEIMRLQEKQRENSEQATMAKQDAAVARAQSDSMRAALRASESDLMRLHNAHDQAAILEQKLAQMITINRELAKQGAREADIGRILVNGVDRLRDEKSDLVKERDQLAIDRTHLTNVENELQKLRAEFNTVSSERNHLLAHNQQLTNDLLSATRDIERYLARVNATHLQDYLAGDNNSVPLLAIQAGKPLALTGDYLLTLRIDHGSQPGTVLTNIVVQRPNSATNPDITVVLYDQQHQPLRRLAYSFPHVDAGRPFVASSTEIACEHFPAYARIHVTPGLDGLSAKR
jgi:hypothetical protein